METIYPPLDDVTPVSDWNDEIVVPETGVIPHDVPKDGVVANRNHGLWNPIGLLGHPRPEPPSEDDRLHTAESTGCCDRPLARRLFGTTAGRLAPCATS